MPHRLNFPDTPQQQSTNIFIMEVWKSQKFVGKRIMTMTPNKDGNGVGCSAEVMNNAKKEISEEGGYDWLSTGAKFIDVYKDDNGFLFYWKWFNDIGNVKTLLN